MANLADRLVKIEHGVPKVSQKLAEFMASCKAKQNTRFAIACVGVKEGVIAVTNGRTLLAVTPIEPRIADGLYHLTDEGFLLKTDGGQFPKWQEIIPKGTKSLGDFVIIDDISNQRIAEAIKALTDTGCLLNIKWLLAALEAFRDCGCDEVTIQDPEGNNPILITGSTHGEILQYIQMPINGT